MSQGGFKIVHILKTEQTAEHKKIVYTDNIDAPLH